MSVCVYGSNTQCTKASIGCPYTNQFLLDSRYKTEPKLVWTYVAFEYSTKSCWTREVMLCCLTSVSMSCSSASLLCVLVSIICTPYVSLYVNCLAIMACPSASILYRLVSMCYFPESVYYSPEPMCYFPEPVCYLQEPVYYLP